MATEREWNGTDSSVRSAETTARRETNEGVVASSKLLIFSHNFWQAICRPPKLCMWFFPQGSIQPFSLASSPSRCGWRFKLLIPQRFDVICQWIFGNSIMHSRPRLSHNLCYVLNTTYNVLARSTAAWEILSSHLVRLLRRTLRITLNAAREYKI